MKRLATVALALSLLTVSVAMADSRRDESRHRDRSNWSGERHDARRWHRDDRQHRGHDRNWDRRHYDRDRGSHYSYDWRHYDRHRDHSYNRHWNHRPYHYRHNHRHDYWGHGYRVPRGYFARPYIYHDYGNYRLRRPPHGCHWVRINSDLVLAAIATGIVLDVVYDYF